MSDCALLIIGAGEAQRLARSVLCKAGFMVIAVSDVDLAIHLLKKAYYDVVIADLAALKQADGQGYVSKNLSLLLHHTRGTPVLLGCLCPDKHEDLLDLSDASALPERVREALKARRPLRGLSDEDDAQVDVDSLLG